MSFRAALLAALAMAPAAFAQLAVNSVKPDPLQSPSAPAAVAPAPGLRFDASCDARQREELGVAVATAMVWLDRGIQHIRNDPGSAHAARWYGAGQAKAAHDVLDRTRQRLGQPASFTISCSLARCENGTFAYAIPQRSVMNVCNGFWRAAHAGIDSRPGVIVHEMSHIAAGTGDRDREGRFVYGPAAVQRLAGKNDGAAVTVADAHEYFIETLPANGGAGA